MNMNKYSAVVNSLYNTFRLTIILLLKSFQLLLVQRQTTSILGCRPSLAAHLLFGHRERREDRDFQLRNVVMAEEGPKRNLRPPPRLRVKTGCQTCLKRRKKCPENRPVCSTCERLHLECVYRDRGHTLISTFETRQSNCEAVSPVTQTASASPVLALSLSIQPQGLRTERDWKVFNYSSTRYMKMITSPDAPSKYRDLSFIFAIGYDKPWVIHAVLAPAALHASFSSLIPKEDAVRYAQSALRGLRQSLLPERPATLRRDPCLATSIFLAAFEGG